jgi:ATP-dependent exoDNAse (exonuclease V) alpha subunit
MSTAKNIVLKAGQQAAFEKLKAFIDNPVSKIFILKGFAGTGKTTMMRVLIEELQRQELRFSLLASTGRAAKIVSNITNCEAKTVHGLIYSFRELSQDMEKLVTERKSGVDKSGQLLLNFELITVNTDEAEQKELFVDYFLRMRVKNIGQNNPLFNKYMMSDPYLNALRAVFGYALTCHKSQGGEWNHVYLDIAKNVPAIEKPYVYQWIYTAMTRARVQLHVVDSWWIS